MAVLILLLGLFLLFESDSMAQVYKHVGKDGTISFSDSPPASLLKDDDSDKESRSKQAVNPANRKRAEIKDIMQLGHEILKEELAKPPEKQDRRLIKEMTETLYGDVSGKKSK